MIKKCVYKQIQFDFLYMIINKLSTTCQEADIPIVKCPLYKELKDIYSFNVSF